MSKRKKSNQSKKGNVIKNLDQKILQVFHKNPNKNFNYKQIAAKLDIQDSSGRNQIIRMMKELEAKDRLSEVTRGKYVVVKQSQYHEGVVDITSRGNAYVICDDLEHDVRNVPHHRLPQELRSRHGQLRLELRRAGSRL